MSQWLRRFRGAVGMGLTWAAGWALAGVLIGVTSKLVPGLWDSFLKVFDAPLPAMAIPGFAGGVLFSVVLGFAARHRRFEELSLPRFAAWGAVGGLLLTLLPFALVAVGLASREGSSIGAWQAIAAMVGPFAILSTISACGSLMLARIAESREVLGSSERATALLSPDGEPTELRAGESSALQRHAVASPGDRPPPDPVRGRRDA